MKIPYERLSDNPQIPLPQRVRGDPLLVIATQPLRGEGVVAEAHRGDFHGRRMEVSSMQRESLRSRVDLRPYFSYIRVRKVPRRRGPSLTLFGEDLHDKIV